MSTEVLTLSDILNSGEFFDFGGYRSIIHFFCNFTAATTEKDAYSSIIFHLVSSYREKLIGRASVWKLSSSNINNSIRGLLLSKDLEIGITVNGLVQDDTGRSSGIHQVVITRVHNS